MFHMISVDVEDWFQSTYDLDAEIGDRVITNTRILLDLLGRSNTRATFFCQGLVAEKYPFLIKEIAEIGHEIGTHGWSHRSVKQLGKKKFRKELFKSVRLLEDITGRKVDGHRAPDFSIDLEMDWAFEIMLEAGLEYDSSIFPVKGKRYGDPEADLKPFRHKSGLWEVPLTVIKLAGKRLPVLGGGYFRLHPVAVSDLFLRMLQKNNRGAVVYLHPYELNANELKTAEVDFKTRIHQGLFRSRVRSRLKHILKRFRFIAIHDYIKHLELTREFTLANQQSERLQISAD